MFPGAKESEEPSHQLIEGARGRENQGNKSQSVERSSIRKWLLSIAQDPAVRGHLVALRDWQGQRSLELLY